MRRSSNKLITMVQISFLLVLILQPFATVTKIHGFVTTYTSISPPPCRRWGSINRVTTTMIPSQRRALSSSSSSPFHLITLQSSTKNDPSKEKVDDEKNKNNKDNNGDDDNDGKKDESQLFFMSAADTKRDNMKKDKDDSIDVNNNNDDVSGDEITSEKQLDKKVETITPKPIIEEIKTISISTNNVNNKTTNQTASTTAPAQSPSPVSSPYMIQTNNEEYVGIGGKGGYIYDVNKLKNNLVQKSIKQFKTELLQLLIDTTDDSQIKTTKSKTSMKIGATETYTKNDLIDQKISALISSNPVSTTTDSNLLEGEWDFAYATDNAVDILEDSRVILSKSKPNKNNDNGSDHKSPSSSWKLKPYPKGTIFQSWSRHICLERLKDDEDPYMIDCTSHLNGLSLTERRYKIVGVSDKKSFS